MNILHDSHIALNQLPPLDVAQPNWTAAEMDMLAGNTALDLGRTALDAMMEQQLTFETLSLDSSDTAAKLQTEEGLDTIMATNFQADTLQISPFTVRHHYDMVDFFDEEDKKSKKTSTR